MECLDQIIEEAKCCAGKLGHSVSQTVSFGNTDPSLTFDFMRLMAYIDTLERNKVTYKMWEEVIYETPKKVNLNSLHKSKKHLYLNQEPERRVICHKEKILPCLSESEIRSIIEQIKLLCSNCNCDCN